MDWCWSWNSNTLATWCKELTHWIRPWCWEWLKVGEEGDNRGWDGWMAPPTQWTWIWAGSWSWWWTEWPGMLQSMGSQVGHDWATELNWTDAKTKTMHHKILTNLLMFLWIQFKLFIKKVNHRVLWYIYIKCYPKFTHQKKKKILTISLELCKVLRIKKCIKSRSSTWLIEDPMKEIDII